MSPKGGAQTSQYAPRPGDRVGSFEIVAELGRGGMGIVYRARDTVLKRDVALKRPKPEFAEKPEFCRRFLDEARTASKLNHPNITTVFEAFEEDGVSWMAMEFVAGDSLRDIVNRGGRMTVEQTLLHAQGLADALATAHSSGILHRDINPNNVLVGHDGRSRLSDFGLAHALDDSSGEGVSSEASTQPRESDRGAGTRGYMSPEQALGRPLDPSSDLFSLGLVVYEMCTGEAAFGSSSSRSWLDALLHHEPRPAGKLNPEVPDELERIISKAIAKRRDERYQSAHEMLADISALRRRVESGNDVSSWPMQQTRRRSRYRKGLAGAAIAAAVLGAAVTVWRLADSLPGNVVMALASRQVTTGSGWEGGPSLSPEGSMIAYCSDQSGNPDIWIIHASGGDPLQLTSHQGSDTDPAWFPNDGMVVFVSDRSGERAIWRIPPLGGVPALLVPNAEDPAVSPDGQRIAFARAGPSGLLRIHVAPLDDPLNARALTGDEHGLWDHEHPAWSPDGRTLCYADFRNLWLVPVDGGSPRRLTAEDARDHDPEWSADGEHIFFCSGRDNTLALWRINAGGGEPERLTPGTAGEVQPSLSRDDRWLAYATRDSNPDIIVLDRRTGSAGTIAGATTENEPVVAPDGRSVVFMSDRRGTFDLWLQDLRDGKLNGAPRRITDHPGIVAVPNISPDGRWLAYFRVIEGQMDIWVLPIAGGVARRFTEHSAADIHPTFSPDGTRLAFVSDRDGVENIWLAAVADGQRTGEPQQLTHGDTAHIFPVWSPDGRRIACVVAHGHEQEVFIIGVDSETPPVQLTRGARAVRAIWDPSGNEILVSGTWGGDRVVLRRVSVSDGSLRPFEPELELGPEDNNAGLFSLDAEGRILAYAFVERRGDIWLAAMPADQR